MHLICYMPFDMYPWNLLPSWGANGEILNPKCFSSQQYERTMFLWANYSGIFWSPKFCENFSIFLGVTAEPILYIYLSHKLRCYRGISGPEKSRNNTREKISYFFTCVDIANQLLTRHSPLAPLGQVDEWTAKPSRFSIQVVCRSFLELWRLKH